nr:hypothetical protein [Paenibacillus glacialis]
MIRNFALVVVNLIGELWIGVGRKPTFYDNHTANNTKTGYVIFVSLAALISIGVAIWLTLKLY